ncbi:hypothetical protein [Roseimaritima ulvae]|nr:hypothetical protein [Roseimaritima ulvae]
MSETIPQPRGNKTKIKTKLKTFWFLRGMVLGLLLVGTANAVSYFVRSDGWGSLLGDRQADREAIGFPLELWRAGSAYGGLFVARVPLLVNALTAVLVGACCGALMVINHRWLEQMLIDLETREREATQHNFQFTLQGLLVITVLAAVAAMLVKTFASRPESLLFIYVLGPTALVLLALLPYRIAWQQRVAILAPITIAMIAVALAIGASLGIEFDVVLMGIFICWVPQSMLAATALTVSLMIQYQRQQHRQPPSQS